MLWSRGATTEQCWEMLCQMSTNVCIKCACVCPSFSNSIEVVRKSTMRTHQACWTTTVKRSEEQAIIVCYKYYLSQICLMDVGGQWLPTGANCKCIEKHPKARIYPTHDSRACVCRYLTELPNSTTINIIKYLLDSIPFLFAYRTSWNSVRGFLQLQEPSYARLPSERGANLNTLRKDEVASASATTCMQI